MTSRGQCPSSGVRASPEARCQHRCQKLARAQGFRRAAYHNRHTAKFHVLLTWAGLLQGAGSSQNHLFRQVRARIPIKLLPESISNVSEAVSQELSVCGDDKSDVLGSTQNSHLHLVRRSSWQQMLLRLDPILGGVPLTISRVKLPQVSVPIFEDQPQLHLDVTCDILLFSPQVRFRSPSCQEQLAGRGMRRTNAGGRVGPSTRIGKGVRCARMLLGCDGSISVLGA
jgi:hypothetical protein